MRCHLTAARLPQFEFECESGPYMSARWAMLRHSGKEVVRRDAILRRRRNSYASGGAFRPYELRGSQEIRRADEAETAYQERRPRRRYPTASRGGPIANGLADSRRT